MTLTEEQSRELREAVEAWMGSKGISECPLCSESAWAFDSMDLVFAPAISSADIVAGRGRSRDNTSEKMLLSRLREGRRLLRNISGDPRAHLIKLFCDNCGYVLLLDAAKVRRIERE